MTERLFSLITGGSRGIGSATARRLASAGHDLLLVYRSDRPAAEETAAAARGRGARCDVVQADLTDEGGVEAVFTAAACIGQLTGVVNNAGATFHLGSLADTPVDIVRRTIELNLTVPILVARLAVQAMARSRGGRGGVIVNVSSGAATIGSPNEYVQYSAAKAGVDALTLGLAQEVADEGIRVVGVAPGIIETRIHADAGDPDRPGRVGANVPLGRSGAPEEVAEAVAWLMSDAASYITGTTLRVAGGR